MILKKDLLALSKDIKALSRKVDRLVKEFEKNGKVKVSPKGATKKISAGLTATDQVLKVIRSSEKGVSVPALKEKTGFGDKTIRNILYGAFTGGKIKRAGRGIYVAVK